jgi:ATP-dependent RNA helicase DDX10/DBP4
VSYLRSVHLHRNKDIFKLEELPVQQYAESLGLPGAPKIKFLSKEIAKKRKNASRVAVFVKGADANKSEGAAEEERSLSSESDVGSDSDEGTVALPDKVSEESGFRFFVRD